MKTYLFLLSFCITCLFYDCKKASSYADKWVPTDEMHQMDTLTMQQVNAKEYNILMTFNKGPLKGTLEGDTLRLISHGITIKLSVVPSSEHLLFLVPTGQSMELRRL